MTNQFHASQSGSVIRLNAAGVVTFHTDAVIPTITIGNARPCGTTTKGEVK